jgi:hypothetical protein
MSMVMSMFNGLHLAFEAWIEALRVLHRVGLMIPRLLH